MRLEILFVFVLFIPVTTVYGHGVGLDSIKGIDANGEKISITIEMPSDFEQSANKQIVITATDDKNKQLAKNVTFLIGLFYENEMIFRNYFFTEDGILSINVNPNDEGPIMINGQQDSFLGAWYATESQPIELVGPIFKSGGLYTFEIELRTINEPTNIIENNEIYKAYVSVADTTTYPQKDQAGNPVKFRVKSYYDKLSDFNYDAQSKRITLEMPFDWSTQSISHIPVVHVEVHFPKDFSEFLYPSYGGQVNGVDLFKSSITVDDYTEEEERIVHFVLLNDHLKFIKSQLKQSGSLSDKMTFTLYPSDEIEFPLTAMTPDEQFQVDLSWDPINLEPNTPVKFIFTIRDGSTGEPLRNSSYDFIILQNGEKIHQSHGVAVVGGSFETYTFSESQTGPTVIRFENIRDSQASTEFDILVAPEFGVATIIILLIGLGGATLLRYRPLFFK